MKEPNYAPMYVALYPQLAEVVRAHGYALAVHGSLGRDMDLICVPWVEQPRAPSEVVTAITGKFAIKSVGKPNTSHHGRQRWTISVGFGDCQIDLSFMPRTAAPPVNHVSDEPTPPPDRVRVLEQAIGNCFMMAKRQIATHLKGASTPSLDLERWQHVFRFCETTGSKSDILRGQLPTEMTEGEPTPPPIVFHLGEGVDIVSPTPPVAIGRCGTCQHFGTSKGLSPISEMGACRRNHSYGWPADGSGFCHLHSAK